MVFLTGGQNVAQLDRLLFRVPEQNNYVILSACLVPVRYVSQINAKSKRLNVLI